MIMHKLIDSFIKNYIRTPLFLDSRLRGNDKHGMLSIPYLMSLMDTGYL